ncbi:MAG: hypothetical protein ACLGHG_08115 [Gammaproteobacteria bacterium]
MIAASRWSVLTKNPRLFMVAAMVVGALLYLQAVGGPFLHDDFANIVLMPEVHATSWPDVPKAISVFPTRPLAMLSFSTNHLVCGLETSCFKTVNLLIHLLTGLALFFFLQLLLNQFPDAEPDRSTRIASIVAAIWIVHPLNVSTTLYVVQRMTQLYMLFTLVALAAWIALRARHGKSIAQRAGLMILLALASTAAATSKETSILLPAFILLIELATATGATRRRLMIGLAAAAAVLVLASPAWYPPVEKILIGSYRIRDFSMAERLMTEARVILFYVSEIFWPDADRMRLYLDDIPLSTSPISPWTTLPAMIALVSVASYSLWCLLAKPTPISLGILFFLLGHAPESSAYGLHIAYEHRNYLPMTGLLLASAWALPATSSRATAIVPVFAIACVISLAVRTADWASEESFISNIQQQQPLSANANIVAGGHFITRYNQAPDTVERELYFDLAVYHFERAMLVAPQDVMAASRLLMMPIPPDQRSAVTAAITERAARYTPHNMTISASEQMAVCIVSEPKCLVDPGAYVMYAEALLANPKLTARFRWRIQRAAAAVYVRALGNTQRGLELSRLAAASGDPAAITSLVKNLLAAGLPEEAEKILEVWRAPR